MSRIDDYISSLGYDLEDLQDMPESEVQEILGKYFSKCAEVHPEELGECRDRLEEDLQEVGSEIGELIDRLRERDREERRDNLEEETKELKKFLRELTGDVTEAYKKEADLFRDFSGDVTVSSDSIEMGKIYTYTNRGGTGMSPFGNRDENPLKGVTRDGTINSEVIKDVNDDKKLTADDIDFALEQANIARQNLQNVTINTNPGWHWEFDKDASTASTIVWNVTDEEGKTAQIIFENAANVTFEWSSGLTEVDLDAIKDWPKELSERSYWTGTNVSFWDELHPMTADQRLKVMPGFTEISETDQTEIDPFTDGATDGPLSEKLATKFHDMIALMFQYLEDRSMEDITEFWMELTDLIGALDPEEKSRLLQHFLITLYLKERSLFETFCGSASVVAQIESMLHSDWDSDPSRGAKLGYLLLETQTNGSGQYERETLIASLFAKTSDDGSTSVDGKWKKNTDNVWALEKLNELIVQHGGTPVQGLADVKKTEAKADTYKLSEDKYKEIVQKAADATWQGYILETDGTSDDNLSDGTGGAELRDAIKNICQQISVASMTVEEMQEKILSFINGLPNDSDNDIANALVHLLHDHSPELLAALTETPPGPDGKTWADKMWEEISHEDPHTTDGNWGNDSIDDEAEHKGITFGYLYGE